jgi:hypothetical protein
LNALREGYRKNNGAGRLAGLEALSYKNHSPDRSGPAANRFYELNNGGWVYRSNSPREVNGGVSFSEPTLNDDGYFYYIFNEDTKRWHELLLPAAGVSTTSDPYLVQAFWKGMKGVARYALPLEDAIILIDGKDFDGNQASEAEAGVLLIAGFVPGGKILKPVLRVVKGAKVWRIFTRQGGRTYITDLFKLAPLFKTGANRSFFWSGKTNGIGGVNRAMEIASSKGGTTLEGLIKSTNIDIPKWDLSNPQSVEAWKEVSRLYAEQASGEVRAIIGKDLRPDSLWEIIELPDLKKNKQVTKKINIYTITIK